MENCQVAVSVVVGLCREVYGSKRHRWHTRTVSDPATGVGTPRAALFQTLVARQAKRLPKGEVASVRRGGSDASSGHTRSPVRFARYRWDAPMDARVVPVSVYRREQVVNVEVPLGGGSLGSTTYAAGWFISIAGDKYVQDLADGSFSADGFW
jgi:hypothetical protein